MDWIKRCHSWNPDQKAQMEREQKEFRDLVKGEKVVIIHVYNHPAGNGSWTIVTNYGRIYHMRHTRFTVYQHYDYWISPEKIFQLKSRCEAASKGWFSFEDICDFIEVDLKSISLKDLIDENERLETRCEELEAALEKQSKLIQNTGQQLRGIVRSLI